jgi:hypothetical protein
MQIELGKDKIMRKELSLVLIIVAVITLLVVSNAATVQRVGTQKRTDVLVGKKKNAQNPEDSHIPVVDFDSAEPTDPLKRQIRKSRSRRHNLKDPSVKPEQRKQFVLNERSVPVNYGGPWSDAPDEPALPVQTSDAILVGDITSAAAHLSDDKTSIYSESTVIAYDVLSDKTGGIFQGSTLIAERSGGAVRFRSGKILIRGLLGKPLPKVNARYLFFLKYQLDGNSFLILTAYELRGGHVVPLDGLTPGGQVVTPFASYQKYKSFEAPAFLEELRRAIRSTEAPVRGGRR